MAIDTVTNITNNYATGLKGTTVNRESKEMGDFMTLLMAQLKNQNPLDPVQDKDFIAQMAQINSLTELQSIKTSMTDMSSSYKSSFATSLIGRQIRANVNDEIIEGTVKSISLANGTPTAILTNNTKVAISAIFEVQEK